MDIQRIAGAFSRHRFVETYPYLADDVRWNIVGDKQVVGREDVARTREQSAKYLAGVTTTFSKFRLVVGKDSVVVDSEAEYADLDGSSVVASCDSYDFTEGRLSAITSYTIELGGSAS